MRSKSKVKYPDIAPRLGFVAVVARGLPYLVALVVIFFGVSVIDLDNHHLTNYDYAGKFGVSTGAFGGAIAMIAMGALALAFLIRSDLGNKTKPRR